MKIVGLITEYNPFHNGHRYHIEESKRITGADCCISVMSGNFVQRGAPAFLPKHLRADMALDGGCDMVIELPACYATGSAEFFAQGAVSLLDKLGCVDFICFGSECGNYQAMHDIAQILIKEPAEYAVLLQKYLKSGISFPAARQQALKDYFHTDEFDKILDSPNNILGIEYIKALLQRNSKMIGFTIARKDSSYHDTELSQTFSSASAIRHLISENAEPSFDKLKGQITDYSYHLFRTMYHTRYPVVSNDFSLLLKYRLLHESAESLTQYLDISTELANRIKNLQNKFISFNQFCELLKTKELTYSRISRCLIHILLNIKKEDMAEFANHENCGYARILGFKKTKSDLFSVLKTQSQIPLLSNLSSADALDECSLKMLNLDIFAADLYESVVSNKYHLPFINERIQQIIKK